MEALEVKSNETEVDPIPTWEGMLGLARETAAKKVRAYCVSKLSYL
jgi:hypothetical protein